MGLWRSIGRNTVQRPVELALNVSFPSLPLTTAAIDNALEWYQSAETLTLHHQL
jgi:hypothetical protein